MSELKIDTSPAALAVPIDFRKLHDSPSPKPREPDPESLAPAAVKVHKKSWLDINAIKDVEKTEVFCLQYSQDSRFLGVGCGDGTVRIFNAANKLAYTMNLGPNKLPTTCLRFRPASASSQTANIVLTGNADGTVSHWHMTSQKCVYTIAEDDNQIYTVDYRPDAEMFATAGRDCKVRIYEENTKTLLRTMSSGHSVKTAGHSNRVYAAKFKPDDPNIVISGGWDNTVQIWDTRVGHSIRSIFGPHICGDAIDVRGDQILTASWRPEDALQLWDFGSGKLLHTLPWSYTKDSKQPEMLYAAAFSPDGQYIAAGGCGTNEGKLFDAKELQLVDRVFLGDKGVYALSFAPNCRKLAFGGGQADVNLWDL